MRIVLISEIFANGMGYLENVLPKYLARRGAEVNVIASSLAPNYRQDPERAVYRGFANADAPGTVETLDGFRLHVVQHTATFGHVRLVGLRQRLHQLRPDIVQIMTPIGWIAIDAALARISLGYKLFGGCHYHASVFPLAQKYLPWPTPARLQCFFARGLHGRAVSWFTEKYYAISEDCAKVAARFFGVPREKLEISPLGVDTEVFHPIRERDQAEARKNLRARLSFCETDIVCVYSGRFTDDKNPLLLARAVAALSSAGEPFHGLFIGNGPQGAEIAGTRGCVLHPFVPMRDLASFYRAADIGVWPAQESMSMLDAAACGLPLLANDQMGAPERLRGCGLDYQLGNAADLAEKILLLKSAHVRSQLGAHGARRMKEEYSWEAIAARRLTDYSRALVSKPSAGQSRSRIIPSSLHTARAGGSIVQEQEATGRASRVHEL